MPELKKPNLPIGYWIKKDDEALTTRINEAQEANGLSRNLLQEVAVATREQLADTLHPFAAPDALGTLLNTGRRRSERTSPMREVPKYSLMEFERRWLVDRETVGILHSDRSALITDKYFPESRLRLRRVERSSGEVRYKLCKKYGKRSTSAEPIVNVYLSESEFHLLNGLPGVVVSKRRFYVAGGALDVYLPPHEDLAIFEREFPSESVAERYDPPSFVSEEVTNDPLCSGAGIALDWDNDARRRFR